MRVAFQRGGTVGGGAAADVVLIVRGGAPVPGY
jgi:hypothetical protein